MTVMKSQWIDHCLAMARRPAEFYSGCRKIHTGVMLEFPRIDDSLLISDCGFTKSKLTMLRRLYWDESHAEAVAALWRGRLERAKYGSVSVSTYHHLTKSDPEKRSKRASVMGPCLVGVGFTLLNRTDVAVDAWYRTSELLKKFPADLVFIRETVLPAIGVDSSAVVRLRCHFANLTSHPMYWVTAIPHMLNPTRELDEIQKADPRFYKWTIRWTSRYLLEEHAHGIQKFAQAMRVAKDARERIPAATIASLVRYCRDNHPGYDRDHREEEDGEED